MKKIALISDIHSSYLGLDIILKDAGKRGLNEFIFAGDYVTDGPEPDEVIQAIKGLTGHFIRGNREDYILGYHNGRANDWNDSLQCAPLLWTYNKLSKSSIDFIKTLPERKTIKVYGHEILISHGTPYGTRDVIKPFKNSEKFHQIALEFEENVFIFGHTHTIWALKYKNKYFINAGCSGMPVPGSYTDSYFEYIIMNISERELSFEKIHIPFDFKMFERYYDKNNYLQDNGIWVDLLLTSIKTGQNYCIGFLEYCHEIAKQNGKPEYKLIPNDIWENAIKTWPYKMII